MIPVGQRTEPLLDRHNVHLLRCGFGSVGLPARRNRPGYHHAHPDARSASSPDASEYERFFLRIEERERERREFPRVRIFRRDHLLESFVPCNPSASVVPLWPWADRDLKSPHAVCSGNVKPFNAPPADLHAHRDGIAGRHVRRADGDIHGVIADRTSKVGGAFSCGTGETDNVCGSLAKDAWARCRAPPKDVLLPAINDHRARQRPDRQVATFTGVSEGEWQNIVCRVTHATLELRRPRFNGPALYPSPVTVGRFRSLMLPISLRK